MVLGADRPCDRAHGGLHHLRAALAAPRFSLLRAAAAHGDPTSIDALEGRSDPCREVRTRNGIRVLLATTGALSLEASALLGGTLVHLSGDRITEPEVLAYYEALRPVKPDELEFKRG